MDLMKGKCHKYPPSRLAIILPTTGQMADAVDYPVVEKRTVICGQYEYNPQWKPVIPEQENEEQ